MQVAALLFRANQTKGFITRKRKMTEEELIKLIAEWCSKNGKAESRLLYRDPQHYVCTFKLFDMLVEKTSVTKEQIGKWFDESQAEQEAQGH